MSFLKVQIKCFQTSHKWSVMPLGHKVISLGQLKAPSNGRIKVCTIVSVCRWQRDCPLAGSSNMSHRHSRSHAYLFCVLSHGFLRKRETARSRSCMRRSDFDYGVK